MNDKIKEFLEKLGYIEQEAEYIKNYNNYHITVNKQSAKINYGSKIKNDRQTTTNLSYQDETMVVLECIDRLLTLGYLPEDIILEKAYPSGRNDKGQWLDILVTYNNSPFLMIECKTLLEYNKEIEKMEKNGGQLFSYYTADRTPKLLCLYTSKYSEEDTKFIYFSNIIKTNNLEGNNKTELYNSWDKTFEKNGIFESECLPYSIEFKGIKKNQLRKFTQYDVNINGNEGTIFNRFSEILRRNAISDKNNAYNKIFNLILCKIVDEEERNDNEYTWFQWRDCENAETVLSRLSDLYKKGMDKYLKLDISDVSENDLDKVLLANEVENSEIIKSMFRKLRLYKNNEFAFNEVINERTFEENAKVVKEVVKMLEEYQIKYSSKHQFLGDFFEKLLNIGVKQESGQFFTPIPIANFIVNSLPIEKIIDSKIKSGDNEYLPYIIDYACGSGHFLTESMQRVNKYVKKLTESNFSNNNQKNKWRIWKNDYLWANEFVCGIELDYRLAKTTKVACFLNGDGEANILYANGLDNFNSENYYKKLKIENNNKNEQFDIVVANPPYSVNDFMKQLKTLDTDFTLVKSLTEKSDDIETIFVERTWQLLKDGGYCGIILPDTILTNASPVIFIETRKFILKYFDIVGITNLGENTFIKTGQTTTVLFMKKRSDTFVKTIENKCKTIINNAITDKQFQNKELTEYIKDVYSLNSINEYIETLSENNCVNNEYEKFTIYYLNKDKNVILAKTGKKQDEIEFLGYKHTDMRNYEGIRPYPDNDTNKIKSRLYNEDKIEDYSKVSTYIYKNFLDEKIDNNLIKLNKLEKNIKQSKLLDVISLKDEINNETKEDYMILTKEIKDIECPNTGFIKKSISDLVGENNISNGGVAPKPRYFLNDEEKEDVFIRAKHLNNIIDREIRIEKENYFVLDQKRTKFKKGTIVFPKSGQSVNTSNIAIIPCDAYIVNHLATIYTENEYIRDYIYYILKHYKTANMKLTDTGYPTIRISTIQEFEIPFPETKELLIEIVDKLNIIDRENRSDKNIHEEENKVLETYNLKFE